MKKSRFSVRSGLLICLAVSCLAAGLSACPDSLLDDPLKTPGNFTVEAYSYMAYLSWDPVPGVAGYRVRLNGETAADLSDPSASSWSHVASVLRGDKYAVSAVYSGGREGQPAGPLVVREVLPPYTLMPPDPDGAPRSIISGPGTAQPAQWAGAAILSSQTAHYYIIPIDNNYNRYRIWWNDGYQGDGTKTLDVRVYAWWYGTNTYISPLLGVDSGYNNAGISVDTSSADNTGYVVLMVEPWSSGSAGTYGIAYNYD
jgi:hypothetical protein